MMILGLFVFAASAQVEMTSHKSMGSKVAYDVTLESGTLDLTPKYSVTSYTVALDQAVTIDLLTTNADPGNVVYLVLVSDATGRTVTWGTNVQGSAASVAVTASKIIIIGFLYNGTKFVQVSSSSEY